MVQKRMEMTEDEGEADEGNTERRPLVAWKASKGSGTDPAARKGHFEKAADGANNGDKAGGREELERRDVRGKGELAPR